MYDNRFGTEKNSHEKNSNKLPYFPVNNAHLMYKANLVFSVLSNFFNRYRAPYVYRAPENTWNRTTGCGQARI
jgi:hypothetical protein